MTKANPIKREEIMRPCNREMKFNGYTQATHVANATYKCPVCGKVIVNEDEYEHYTSEEI